jgi:branched-chain amino acid transport system substrate-binding protein
MKNRKMSLLPYAVAGIVIIGAIVTACGKSGSETKTAANEWRIPYMIFLSGPLAGDGAMHKWLTSQVVDEINGTGGIAGKPVVIDFYDTALDPPKAAACMAKIIDSRALCLIGPMNDNECKAAMPLAQREGIYAFSGTATDDVRRQFKPWILNTSSTAEEEKEYDMPMWLEREPGIQSLVGILEPMYPYITTVWEVNKSKAAELGVKAYDKIEVPSGMLDYSSIAVRALATGADAFYLACSEEVTAKIVKELIDRGANPRHIWLWDSSMGATFLKQAGGYCEGIYTPVSPTFSENPKFDEFLKRYRDTHNGELLKFMSHFNAELLYLIKEAIEEQGITGDPAKLKEERIKIRDYANNKKGFQGLKYTYDIVDGQAVGIPRFLFQIRDGKTVMVGKETPKVRGVLKVSFQHPQGRRGVSPRSKAELRGGTPRLLFPITLFSGHPLSDAG